MSHCAAYGCTNYRKKEECKSKSFFKFPVKNPGLLKAWLKMIRRENFKPSAHSLICSDHFEETCFEYQPFTNRRQLKRGSIPTIFVFKKKASSRRILDRCKPSTSVIFEPSLTETVQTEEVQSEMEMEPSTTSAGTQTDTFGEVIDMLSQKDIAIEKLISTKEINFIPENIRDDTQMKCVTSFTIKEFYCIYRFLQIEDDLSMSTKRRPIDRYFLFLVKLRTGISNEFLAILFGISDSTVSRDFNFVTDVLYEKLKLQDVFPSKDQVIRYMPPPFRMYCKNVRIIVDCTEIEVQKPSSPMEQQNDFQSLQNANTFKGMIGITPNGAISFISELFTGSISDKEVFIRSKLMDRLEPNDVVMADKGFLIANELEKIGCKLYRPIFLEDKIQFDISEIVSNCQLSNSKRVTKWKGDI
ncbi:THAP-type domain-containing protein [Trichonephila clavipes]|nr:THAP-type domain-containing protein [Trichonephila clavipes]